ncbi:pilus assembly protein TadG-related protein [Bacillus salacetis]|uniref:pilus assembly protein TadG-related protein n=1 Tax=Bacillus salacetis TaxID=2315464 RepID=UPI003BA25B8F
MMRKIKRLLLNENGNILVTVALFMAVLLGATGLAVDVGKVYLEKSELQKALDAAVLGGAHIIVGKGEAEAITLAKTIAQKNKYSLEGSPFSTTRNSIKVTKQVTVPMTFAKFIGVEDKVVSASAKAIAAPLKIGTGITPIAVEKAAIPHGTELKCDNTGNHHGNCGYLAIDGSGASNLADGILNGASVSVGDMKTFDTDPGQKWGPVKSAFQTLIDRDEDKPHCQRFDTADNHCARVIYIVVIDTWDNLNGKDQVQVVGLAAYWLEDVNKDKSIKGRFIKTIAPGEIDLTSGGSEYSLYGVKLVE